MKEDSTTPVTKSALSLSALVVVVSTALLPSAIATVGCSGPDASVFAQPAPDSAPPTSDTTAEAGSLFHDDGGSIGEASVADAAACMPAPIPGFTPTWKPPAIAPGGCSAALTGAYFDACLKTPIDAAACTTFMSANNACGACLETAESATKYGPIIWHANRAYFTFNIAGCVAVEQKNVADGSCGASYQASVSCKQAACEGCFSGANPNFQRFNQCETAAGMSACKSYGQTEATTCAGIRDADAATSACFLAGSESTRDLLIRIAPLFCGG